MNVKVIATHFPKDPKKKVVMYASLELFGCLEVHNWRLFAGTTGFQVGYPNSPMAEGSKKFYRQVVPKTPELQQEIRSAVVAAYETVTKAREVRP